MIQSGGDTGQEAKERARALIEAVRSEGEHPQPRVAYLEDPAVEDNLWSVRELGLGATAYPPGKHETHEGWEDAAVPPDRLGDYLRSNPHPAGPARLPRRIPVRAFRAWMRAHPHPV